MDSPKLKTASPDLTDPLRMLREKFDAMLLREIENCGGIPPLQPEEIDLREAIARVLEVYD